MKVSETRVDYWMAYPLKEFSGDDIQAEGPANRWINAIELSDNPENREEENCLSLSFSICRQLDVSRN